ncbi:hypothetical protein GCM10009611_04420 [Arthrobacter roseus]
MAFAGAFWGALVESDDTLRSWLFLAGLLGALTAVVMPINETRATHRKIAALKADLETERTTGVQAVDDAKREGREEFLLVVDFAIRPLLEKLGPLVRSRWAATRNDLATQLKLTALSALKEVIDPSIPRLRANYFKLKYPSAEGQGPYLQDPASTATAPRDRFDLGDKSSESDAILEMLAKNDYIFTPDWVTDPPPGFGKARKRNYRTFISAAAYDGMDVDGMISVDSPEAGSLTDADAVVVQLVATIIAISEAVRDNKRNDTEV